MTDREMRIMEDHTRALQANTRAMQELIPLLQVFANKKFIDMMACNADTAMGAARKFENAVAELATTTSKVVEAAEKNDEAARRMMNAAEENQNAAYIMRNCNN